MKELKAHSSLTSKAFRFRESKLEFSIMEIQFDWLRISETNVKKGSENYILVELKTLT